MADITFNPSVTDRTAAPIPAAIGAAPRTLLTAALAVLQFTGSAIHRWWIERTAAQGLAGLDDASLRDLAVVRSDVERVVKLGRR